MREALTRSPHQVDPLSWFSGPLLPLVFAAMGLAYAVPLVIETWSNSPMPLQQLAGVACITAACLIVYLLTRPHRREIGRAAFSGVLLLGWLGMLLSALDYGRGTVALETWWASLGVSAVLLSLTPYSSALRMAVAGLATVVFSGILTWAVFVPVPDFWPPLTRIVLVSGVIAVIAVACVVFDYQVASRVSRWRTGARGEAAPQHLDDVARLDLMRDELVRVGAMVGPLLERVASSGSITAQDRSAAAEMARSLREDLVARSNQSWLDLIAEGRAMSVVDPDRLAELMTAEQRAAIRGLLFAVLESPVLRSESLEVELREHDDGSTGVALSMHLDLPEGRRITMLAPYYLTLKSTVDNLTWLGGDKQLRLKFQLPARTGRRRRG